MKVFVYGTLKRGFGNNLLLSDAKYLGEDSLEGYDMLDLGWYPAIKRGTGTVHGEVYEISPHILKRLDSLEGTPSYYARTTAITKGKHEVHVYVMNGAVDEQLPSGVWTKT